MVGRKVTKQSWTLEKGRPTFRKLIPVLVGGILFIFLYAPAMTKAEPPASPPTLPARLPTEGSPVKPVSPKILWQDNRLSLETVDWDLRQVFQAISEQTGVEIRLEKEVSGKISYRGEKEPLEKLVDGILRQAGEKNYVLAREGADLRKVYILPRPEAGKAPVPRAKVKGKLKNGKEIEYFPGEIVIGIDLKAREKGNILDLAEKLEKKYGLSLLSWAQVEFVYALRFRILEERDVLRVFEEVLGNPPQYFSFVTPDGLGPRSVEMPREDFHVFSSIVTSEQKAQAKSNNDEYVKMTVYPFLKKGKIYKDKKFEYEYVEGEYILSVTKEDAGRIKYEDVLALANDEGGIITQYVEGIYANEYIIFFPEVHGDDEYGAKLLKLKEWTARNGKDYPYHTDVVHRYWITWF